MLMTVLWPKYGESDMFGLPIILKFIEYRHIMVMIPAKRGAIFNFVCKTPVIKPANAPAKTATGRVRNGFTPRKIIIPATAAPRG